MHLQLRKHQRPIATGEPSPLVIPQRAAKSRPQVTQKQNAFKNKETKYLQTTNAGPARRTQWDAARERECGSYSGAAASGSHVARVAARHGQYMRACARHIRAPACPHLALAEYEDLAPPRARSPSYLYPKAPCARRPPRERDTSLRCPALRRLRSRFSPPPPPPPPPPQRSCLYVLRVVHRASARSRRNPPCCAGFFRTSRSATPRSSSRTAQRSTLRNEAERTEIRGSLCVRGMHSSVVGVGSKPAK
ncbi:hypothetical protein DFH09DRAFT_1315859 [Mycena vulgaris]|nr:hypothetical protein DFH09DRAFT_1315859 [Mycena vulgaris]